MKIGKFKIPNKARITSRSSSITNAFIAAIMPYQQPSEKDFTTALKLLGMTPEKITCVYCGGEYTEWDHLRPFVSKRHPTGYYTTIFNLVPACGKCNQSKGNKDWETWMRQKHSTISDLEKRIEIIKEYESQAKLTPIPVADIIGAESWTKYIALCDEIIIKMELAHKESIILRKKIEQTWHDNVKKRL